MRTCLIAFAVVSAMLSPLPAAEFVVALDGDDANAGMPERPFRTIQRAADMMQAGDVCYIRGGVYRETVNVKASGEQGKPIRFTSCSEETVILSGTAPIEAKWLIHKGNIYKAKVDQEVSQLFVDGQMMVEARWPNQPFERRWDKGTWRCTAKGSEYGKIVDAEVAKTGVDWSGALAVLNVGAWQTFLRPVRNHGAGKDSFEYAKDLVTQPALTGQKTDDRGAASDI